MIAPIILVLLSLAGLAASVVHYGPVLSVPFLISAISAFAAAILVLYEWLQEKPIYVVIDGSNVMYWAGDQPSLETVRQVLGKLDEQGFVPVVWFDANVGYKISDRYLGPAPLSQMLKISVRQVFIAPKGTPADPLLLDAAKFLKAQVVTNDRFRDWTESHPQTGEAGFLVAGKIRNGDIILDLAPNAA